MRRSMGVSALSAVLLLTLASLCLSGCATVAAWRLRGGSYHEHEVKHPGETLGVIAAWYTGSSSNWRSLRTDGGSPDVIRIGDRVYVPKSLLDNPAPLPREFVAGYYRQPARARLARADVQRLGERATRRAGEVTDVESLAEAREEERRVCMSDDELAAYCRAVGGAARHEERQRKESELLRHLIRPF